MPRPPSAVVGAFSFVLVMVSLRACREQATDLDGRVVDPSPREVGRLFLADVLPKLLLRSCHRVLVDGPLLSVAGDGEFGRTDRERVALARDRNRRAFLEVLLEPDWKTDLTGQQAFAI